MNPIKPETSFVQTFILTLLLPISILISVGSFLHARHTGGDLELAILIANMATLLVAMALERLMPHRPSWNQGRSDGWTDWLSFGFLAGLVQPALKVLSPLVVIWAWDEAAGPAAGWLYGMPFVLQVLLATLLAELGKYWAHRWHHSSPRLWWLHALHHSSERLYSVNNFRFHPLNYLINHCMSIIPLMLLGFSAQALLAYVAFSQPILMLQHVNLDLRHGWLNYFISTNQLHRWHHSSRREEGNTNYGSALIVWDLVFGTFHHPKQSAEPRVVGLYSGSSYPSHKPYFAQMLSMFSPACCKS
ncbi:sterol desaturase family protein [Polaromonas sp.]|uniref:sterol desaturase family protein n=1 Tax=Polaromonas sp. TaxID=1869339 RepID=UPI003265DD6D